MCTLLISGHGRCGEVKMVILRLCGSLLKILPEAAIELAVGRLNNHYTQHTAMAQYLVTGSKYGRDAKSVTLDGHQ